MASATSVIDLDKFCFQLKAENLSNSKQKLFLSNIRNVKVEKNLEDNPRFSCSCAHRFRAYI